MGSAVMKPLTRRRGKVKPNEPVSLVSGKKEENAGDIEPTVKPEANTVADPSAELCKANVKPRRVKTDSSKANKQVCCTHFIHIAQAGKLYDSDDEPDPIVVARNERLNTQTTTEKGIDSTVNTESTPVSNLSSTSANRLPQPPDANHVVTTATPEIARSNIPLESTPAHSPDEAARCQVSEMVKEVALAGVHGLAAERTIEDQDVSRDARTPSPEYDDLEDVKVINPSPLEHSATSPLNCDVSVPECKNTLCSGDVGVSISKTNHPAPERKGEHRTELGHIIFIQPSASKESHADPKPDLRHGDGTQLVSSTNRVSQTQTSPCKTTSESKCCQDKQKSRLENRCLSLADKYINVGGNASVFTNETNIGRRTHSDFCSDCKLNNIIGSSDSFADNANENDKVSGRSSVISTNGRKGKRLSPVEVSENLSMNSPHVEEILANGEDFMDGLDERFVRRHARNLSENSRVSDAPPPGHDNGSTASPCSANCSRSSSETSTKLSGVKLPKIDHSRTSLTAPQDKPLSANNSRPTSAKCPRSPANGPASKPGTPRTPHCNSRPNSATSCQQSSRPSSAKLCAGQEDKVDLLRPASQTSNKSSSSRSSAGDSTQGKKPHSKPSSCHSLKPSSAASTPRAGNESPAGGGQTSRVNSRPPSSKATPHVSESNTTRSRPGSGKPSATASDPTNLNSRPQSSHSRRSLTAVCPRAGLDKLSQLDVEQCTEGMGVAQTDSPRARPSQTSIKSDNTRATLRGGGEKGPQMGKLAGLAAHLSIGKLGQQPRSAASGTVRSATKLTSNSSRTRLVVVEEKRNRSLTDISNNFNHTHTASPRFSPCLQPSKATATSPVDSNRLPSVSSPSPRVSSGDSQGEEASAEDEKPSSARGGAGDSASRGWLKDRNGTPSGRNSALRDAESPNPLLNQPKMLSQDQIGSIRKQLYEEGLKPAERDGGVAFFIPVTEDGLQPQANNTSITERLTKSRRSSLNYEERMFLANINRQVQLSKRKEFAVRDLRNVKGATSSEGAETSSASKSKVAEEVDSDFDSSF